MMRLDWPVSVVMPVRNAMPFLDEAVASILEQGHEDFEFVIGDDGSTDGSAERLKEWARRDRRIRLIHNRGESLGPAGSGNWVVRAARHELVARMDADDVSMPDRLRRQLLAFRDHPDAVVVGSLYDQIDGAGRKVRGRDRSVLHKARNVFPAAHGSIMFRGAAFDRVGGYRPQCDHWEDRDLLMRLLREGTGLILPEVLYRHRYSGTSARLAADEAELARAMDLRFRCLAAYQSGRSYEEIIEREARLGPRDRVVPSVLAKITIERLFRGDPRTIKRSWTRRHTSLGWSCNDILVRVFMSWATISPATLRTYLDLRARFADWQARHAVPDGTVHVWQSARLAQPKVGAPQRLPPAARTYQARTGDPLRTVAAVSPWPPAHRDCAGPARMPVGPR